MFPTVEHVEKLGAEPCSELLTEFPSLTGRKAPLLKWRTAKQIEPHITGRPPERVAK